MKPKLTIEQAVEQKLTLIDCVRYYMPGWTAEQCNYYIWNYTCYPFSSEVMMEQLYEALGTGEDLTDYTEK